MNDQARHVYRMVESESIVNVDTIKWEIEADKLDNNNNREEYEINPYYKIITNKVEKETWSYYRWNNGQY